MKYVVAALGAAVLLGGVQPALAKPREDIVLRLPAANSAQLRDPQAVVALRAEAARVIAKACNPGNRLEADQSPDWRCRREMTASFEAALGRQLARLD